uniref:Ferritin n=1 Tax=Clastoptera arizonana TaxID=38151 RepID=A0A1B6BX34_9HEMI
MRILIGIFCLAAVCLIRADDNGHCYTSVSGVCGSVTAKKVAFNCNAKYAGVEKVMNHLQSYAQTHISQSFQYLLMSAYFGNYEVNREGFSKLYRKLSDSTWENSIKLIKYMGHRGDKMNFDAPLDANYTQFQLSESAYNLHELSSLGISLDMEKVLAEKADRIHADTSKHSPEYHDAETINFLEKEFIHEHSENIRELSGHANDVQRLIKGGLSDPSLAIYLFDEYLQKKLA